MTTRTGNTGTMGRRSLQAVALAGALAIIGTGAALAQDSTLDEITDSGFVRVGLSNEAPFAYAEAATGQITGEAPEILRRVLPEVTGGEVELSGNLFAFAGLIPALVADRVDMIGAGMYITPARCEQVDFADPEYQMGSGFITAEGNPLGLTSLQGIIDNPDSRLAVLTGGAEVGYADVAGVPEDQLVFFDTPPNLFAGVQAGQADAGILTTFSLQDLVARAGEGSGVEFVELSEQPLNADGEPAIGYGAMAFRQDDDALREAYNVALAELKDSGELLEIMSEFGFTEAEMTDVKATDICPNIE